MWFIQLNFIYKFTLNHFHVPFDCVLLLVCDNCPILQDGVFQQGFGLKEKADPIPSSLGQSQPGCLKPLRSPSPPTSKPSMSQTVIDSSGAHLRDRSDRVRGKHRPGTSGKARTRTGKRGGEKPALAQTNASPACRDEDMRDIKEQLSSLLQLVPVITEIKAAYDHYNDMERDAPDRHLSEAGPNLLETEESTDAAQDIPDTIGYFNTLTGTCAPQETTVHQELTSGVEKVLTDGMSKDTLSALLDQYHAPANCSRLSVLQCNPEIFKNTSQSAKARDSALQNVQKALIKGLTAILLAFDDLSAILQPAQSGAMKQIADGVALLAHSSHALDLFRRHAFKGELKEEYSSLCDGAHPVVGALFGPNVQDRVKGLNDTLRMARSTQRFHPYSYNRGTRRFPFLGQRQPWQKRGGGYNRGQQHTPTSPPPRGAWGQPRKPIPKRKQ